MSVAHIRQNTTREYPCTLCGQAGNIIREDITNPRLKCNSCGFLYDGKDSLEMKEKGEVPTEAPQIKEDPPNERSNARTTSNRSIPNTSNNSNKSVAIPRNPGYLLVAKAGGDFEFATEKDFKKKLLKWESGEKNYNVYKLTNVDYKVNIDLHN